MTTGFNNQHNSRINFYFLWVFGSRRFILERHLFYTVWKKYISGALQDFDRSLKFYNLNMQQLWDQPQFTALNARQKCQKS